MTGIHRERDRRLAATCAVEVHHFPDGSASHGSGVILAHTEDVARHGLYVRTENPLARGEEAVVAVTLPDRTTVSFPARVAHVLDPDAARALGRSPGMGMQVTGEPPHAWKDFIESLEIAAQRIERPLSIAILDRSAPLRERLETSLRAGGFEAHAVGDVAGTLELCRKEAPDILLADGRTQGSNPLLIMKLLSSESDLSDIAVVLMSEEAGDLARVQAYRRGVRDFIPKPFTDEELMIRLRRVGARAGRRPQHVALRGVLEDVGVPTVLSLLEFEKRPGILVLAREQQVGRIHVSNGKVKRVELPGAPSPQEALDSLLQWRHGSFAFIPGTFTGKADLDKTISSLLLDHARVEDESNK